MNRVEKGAKFAELAKAYVCYQAAGEDLEVVEALERPEALFGQVEDPGTASAEQSIDLDLRLRTARSNRLDVRVRFRMFDDDPHFQVTFWKTGESGRIDPNTRLSDPGRGQLREWVRENHPPGSIERPTSFEGEHVDPLMALSGALTSEDTDIADRHDDYLGQAHLDELRGGRDD